MPFDPELSRARIYVLRDELQLVSETSLGGIGRALQLHREEGDILAGDRVGILDRPDPELPGTWLVNPWAAGVAA